MHHHCHESRERWLERPPVPGDGRGVEVEMAGCPACREWMRRMEAQLRALGDLTPRKAPAELEIRVQEALAGDFVTRDQEAPAIRAVRALGEVTAPPVLDRLVAEELARPAEARSARFVGNLEPLQAPHDLAERLASARKRPAPVELRRTRSWLAPALALAAAAFLTWVGLGRLGWIGGGAGASEGLEPDDTAYSFRIVRPDSLAEMDPLARQLAEALVGNSGGRG